jgi:cytochrome c oxidase cbb3-type subunit 3
LCHKKTGEGDVGPNLTDKAWVYGFDIKDIFSSIKNGRPNGMPEHASKLNPVEIQQVSSYVVQLPFIQGTKPAQGDKIEK